MKLSSYVVFSPAVQDRFWARLTPRDAAYDERDAPATRPRHDCDLLPRKKIAFDALVNLCLTYSVPWHILELGLDGALVRTDTTGLHVGVATDFILRFRYERQPVEHHFPAIVERIEPRGVSLRFGDYGESAYRDLSRLLRLL
jgi:hypothetical protein